MTGASPHALVSQFGGVCQSGENIFPRQLRIVVDNALNGQTLRQSIQDHRDFNSRVADTGSSAADPWVHGNSVSAGWFLHGPDSPSSFAYQHESDVGKT